MRLPRPHALLTALRDPRRWKRWGTEALILIAIVGAVTAWQNRGLASGSAPPLEGMRTDGSFVKLGTAGTAAHEVSPSAREGLGVSGARLGASGTAGKATLVVFWATWCKVCRAEAGNIESVAADWPVITVAMQSGDRDEVRAYLADQGLKTPALEDDDSIISKAWAVRVVPAHFIVDGAGNIRFRVVGYTTTLGLRARLWWAQNVAA